MRVLIVGCGYVGLPVGAELVQDGHQVFGLRRSEADELLEAGITPLRADVTRPETLSDLPRDFDWVVNCAASGGGTADDYRRLYLDGNRHIIAWLGRSPVKKFVYTSSTSVYGQCDGSEVTEQSAVQPEAPTSGILVETEKLLLAAAQASFPAVVLRVAGIYGPGRGYAFKQFMRGEARIDGDGSRYLNMIHRDDLVGAIIAALNQGESGEIYNVVDNEPVRQVDFYGWLAGQLKRPLPRKLAEHEEMKRKRGLTNKRVSNAKLRAKLKYEFKYPHFRAGYAAEIARWG